MELLRKIKSGDIKLVKLFRKCKMCLNKIKTKYQEKGINQKSKRVHHKILNSFTNHEKLLMNCLIIII